MSPRLFNWFMLFNLAIVVVMYFAIQYFAKSTAIARVVTLIYGLITYAGLCDAGKYVK